MGSGSPSVFLGIPLADSTTTLNMLPNIAIYGCTEDMELTYNFHREQMHWPEEQAQNEWEEEQHNAQSTFNYPPLPFYKERFNVSSIKQMWLFITPD